MWSRWLAERGYVSLWVCEMTPAKPRVDGNERKRERERERERERRERRER